MQTTKYVFPPYALAMGATNHPRLIPFNKEIIRAVKFWEKETGLKFVGKILPSSGTYFNYPNIYMCYNDVSYLFHELTHYKQQKGYSCRNDTLNFWRYLRYKYGNSIYYNLPTEKEAYKTARILKKKLKIDNYDN